MAATSAAFPRPSIRMRDDPEIEGD